MKNLIWIIAIICMATFSFSLYPDINKVRNKTFKNHPTPQPGKPKRVESLFPVPKKESNLIDEIEKSREKKEVAKNENI